MDIREAKSYLAIIYLSNENGDFLDYAYSLAGEDLHQFVVRIINSYNTCDNVDFYRSCDMYKVCEV